MTPAQFVALLRDPSVATELRRLPWQYTGGGIPAGKSVLNVLAEVHAGLVDEDAIVAKLLAGIAPERIAEQIAANLPADHAKRVADELAARLQS